MYYTNEQIVDLVRIFDQNERKGYLRLDLNENPGGLPQEFINEVLREVTPGLFPSTRKRFLSRRHCQSICIRTSRICVW